MPEFDGNVPIHDRKSVNLRKPIDQGTRFAAEYAEMSAVLPFLPLPPPTKPQGRRESGGVEKAIS